MSHWKMVRDRNQELFEGKISGHWRVSPDPAGALVKKLGEEYGEFCEARDPGELYDMLDVIHELILLLDAGAAAGRRHTEKAALCGVFRRHAEWTPGSGLTWDDLRRARGLVDSGEKDGAMNEAEEKTAAG